MSLRTAEASASPANLQEEDLQLRALINDESEKFLRELREKVLVLRSVSEGVLSRGAAKEILESAEKSAKKTEGKLRGIEEEIARLRAQDRNSSAGSHRLLRLQRVLIKTRKAFEEEKAYNAIARQMLEREGNGEVGKKEKPKRTLKLDDTNVRKSNSAKPAKKQNELWENVKAILGRFSCIFLMLTIWGGMAKAEETGVEEIGVNSLSFSSVEWPGPACRQAGIHCENRAPTPTSKGSPSDSVREEYMALNMATIPINVMLEKIAGAVKKLIESNDVSWDEVYRVLRVMKTQESRYGRPFIEKAFEDVDHFYLGLLAARVEKDAQNAQLPNTFKIRLQDAFLKKVIARAYKKFNDLADEEVAINVFWEMFRVLKHELSDRSSISYIEQRIESITHFMAGYKSEEFPVEKVKK